MPPGMRQAGAFTFQTLFPRKNKLVELSNVSPYYGGYSLGVPPLPIPHREVKPKRADGTAMQRGRVGRRQLRPEGRPIQVPGDSNVPGDFFCVPAAGGAAGRASLLCYFGISSVRLQ